jgi:uncharacterized protein (TIGR04255 family)
MVQDSVSTSLPPPTKTLQEMVLAGHLKTPMPLGVQDLADWIARFADYPIVQELPALPSAQMPSPGQMPSFEFNVGGVTLPRMLLRSADGRFSVQLQGDRFAFGWSRIEPLGAEAAYPGFEAMLNSWTEISARYEAWVEGRFRSRPQYRMVELSYVNNVPLEVDGKRRRLSELFRWIQPGRAVNSFTAQWAEFLHSDSPGEPPRGVVHSVVVVVGQGPGAPGAPPMLAFNFSGLGAVADGQENKHIISDLHARIRDIYQSAFITDGH